MHEPGRPGRLARPLTSRTIGDMEAVASSAPGLLLQVPELPQRRLQPMLRRRRATRRQPLRYPDPELYLGQHLLGFFRGGAVSQSSDNARLKADLKSIPAARRPPALPRSTTLRRRRESLLQTLGAPLPMRAAADPRSTTRSSVPSPRVRSRPAAARVAQLNKADLVAALGAERENPVPDRLGQPPGLRRPFLLPGRGLVRDERRDDRRRRRGRRQ